MALFLASCNKVDVIEPQPLPFAFSDTLLRIDSLMQHDADSALQMLLSFRVDSVISTEAQRSGEISCHYQSILLSEALYKTYNPQLNRYRCETLQETSLQDAMRYFDSLALRYQKNDDLAMLSARSHYMNGVGFYENDSVVEACGEYLHTLEIMEDHFDVDKLTGFRAKFMALTYNRLVDLFSNQFMMEPAICCGKRSLYYCKITPTSKYGVANSLCTIGTHYDMLSNIDSAYIYYRQALEALPDSSNLIYRNVVTLYTISSYYTHNISANESIRLLKEIVGQTRDNNEILLRKLCIGSICYNEEQYDTAIVYLKDVFDNNADVVARFQSAEYLQKIYKELGNSLESDKYNNYLVENTKHHYEIIVEVSVLDKLFYDFEKHHQGKISYNRNKKTIVSIIIILFITIIVVTITKYIINKHESHKLNKEHQLLKEHLIYKENKHLESLKRLVVSIYNEKRENSLEQILKEFDGYYPGVRDTLQRRYPFFSKTELTIVILSYIGFRIKEEAILLGLSENTVGKYRSNIRKKAGKDLVSKLV